MGRGWINCTPVWVVAVAAGWALSGCSDGPITSGSGDAIAVDARVVDAQAAADARVADAAPGPEVSTFREGLVRYVLRRLPYCLKVRRHLALRALF